MYLGEIIVPQNDPDWVSKVSYRADPPIAVRGSFDPYNQERKRAVWLAEESAWKKIVPLQNRYNQLKREEAETLRLIQHWIRDIERLTGKKSGMADASNYAVLLYSISGGPYAWVAAIAKLGVGMILGIGKKKQAKSIMHKLEELGKRMTSIQAQLARVVEEITPLIEAGRMLKVEQGVQQAADIERSGIAYQQRALSQREQGMQHAALVRYYSATAPARQMSPNDL